MTALEIHDTHDYYTAFDHYTNRLQLASQRRDEMYFVHRAADKKCSPANDGVFRIQRQRFLEPLLAAPLDGKMLPCRSPLLAAN